MGVAESSFFAGVAALKEDVGRGTLRGEVEVNQYYALYQHETVGLNHPRGGGPHYLRNPLFRSYAIYLQLLGEAVLGGNLNAAMAEAMEHLQSQLDPAAPIDEDPNPIRLRRSGNPKVFDNGAKVYDRPPIDPREQV